MNSDDFDIEERVQEPRSRLPKIKNERQAGCAAALKTCIMSDLFWQTQAQMERLRPFFQKCRCMALVDERLSLRRGRTGSSRSALAANGDFASDPETAMEPRIATRGAFDHTGGVLDAETRPYSGAR